MSSFPTVADDFVLDIGAVFLIISLIVQNSSIYIILQFERCKMMLVFVKLIKRN